MQACIKLFFQIYGSLPLAFTLPGIGVYRDMPTELPEGRLKAVVFDRFGEVGVFGLGLLGEDVHDGEADAVQNLVTLKQVGIQDSDLEKKVQSEYSFAYKAT